MSDQTLHLTELDIVRSAICLRTGVVENGVSTVKITSRRCDQRVPR